MAVLVQATYWRRIVVGALRSRVRMSGGIELHGDSLVLEYRERWRDPATLHTVEGPPQRVSVAASGVEIDLERDWLRRPLLVVRAHAFDALRGWPGRDGERCVLRLPRDPGGRQVEAAGDLALRIADLQLRALEVPESSR